ncbi:MAG TPA: ATP-binding protein [Thermoanaerobaculia bacterium]|jgi:two-component system NtrC family sensor kinase|nr:ATP-binding protein [Thermoanaerobaculia bacterium]
MRELRKLLLGAGFLLFLGGALAVAFLSFQRKIESFSRIEMNARAGRGEIEVITPPDPESTASTLRAGDRIVLVDGQPVAGLADPLGTLSRPPFPHALAVVRGNEVAEAATGAPAPRIDLPYLFLAFVGILYLLIGLVTLGRERTTATALFTLFCVSSFAIDVLTPSGPVDGIWKTIWLAEDFYRALAPALLLHFFLVFPRPARRRAAAIYLLPALYLGGQIALSVPGAVSAPRLSFWVELLERFWLFYFAAYTAAAIVRIVNAARNRADASSQRQARWIALGTTFGLSPFLLLYVIPRAFGLSSTWAACAGVVPLVFVPLGFAYALWRWRLWDVDIFAREAVATTAAVFLGAASFVVVNTLLNRVLVGFASEAKNLLAFGSGLFLASLLVPVKRRFSNAIERIQYGETYRARRALLDFSREWRGVRDTALLAEALASAVSEALKVSPCRLFLFDRPLPPGISGEALLEKLSAADSIRIRSVTFPSGEDLTFLRLHDDGYRHLLALKSGGRVVGALAVGTKEGKVPLSSEDHALLATVLAQASLAVENSELYRALERRMDEIRGLQEFQEGVIRSSSAGIVVLDAGGRLVSVNPAFEKLIEAAEKDLVGRPLAEILPEIPAGELDGGTAERSFDVQTANRRGEARIYRISASPLRGSATSRVVIFDDITERIALEKGLSEKERLASLGVLAAGVAHEVNTPLAGISSYAQMLLADTDHADPRYAILKKMERQTFRASRLVGNLLEFARGRHGTHDAVDLARVLHDAIESSEPAFAARAVRVEVRGIGSPLPSRGDARELEQVFVNLLINGRDASPDGGTVEVSVAAEPERWRTEIADRGKGLTEEEARRAFEPFFTTRQSGGTGLGLTIAREIVERHGGEIRLAPREGGGAVATVFLPRA